jgi:hypothetical protein
MWDLTNHHFVPAEQTHPLFSFSFSVEQFAIPGKSPGQLLFAQKEACQK